jgi:hypothetical protein
LANQIRFYYKGVTVNYMPDEKVLVLIPGKAKKDDFLQIKSKIDTLLRVSGTKRTGNSFSMKLDPNFNVDVPEVLKSIEHVKGGLEIEDAQSMVSDAAEDSVEQQEQGMAGGAAPDMASQQPQGPEQNPQEMQQEAIKFGLVSFLFENDLFSPGPAQKQHKKSKRYGEYWKALESISGKNRNNLKPQDILDIRKKYSMKPASNDRDMVLRSLDKSANYFYSLLMRVRGEQFAEDFDSQYVALDNLRPEDYDDAEENEEMAPVSDDASIDLPSPPDFSGVDYEDISVEDN